MVDDKRQIIFLHVEKTGGTSITRAVWGQHEIKHQSVDQARQSITQHKWNNYLRFSIIRNPWDRLVSKWWWRHDNAVKQGGPIPELTSDGKIPLAWFEQELTEERQRWGLKTSTPLDEILFGGGNEEEPRVHEVLRFESLQRDWCLLLDKYPQQFFGCKRTLGWCNKSSNRERDYRVYYTNKTAALVAQSAPKTLRYFNYSF